MRIAIGVFGVVGTYPFYGLRSRLDEPEFDPTKPPASFVSEITPVYRSITTSPTATFGSGNIFTCTRSY